MNAFAVTMGLSYAVLSAFLCYVVSLLASGLFAKQFYRLYARVLIGICCAMMLAPPLRYIASLHAAWATIGLTIAQYVVVAVLGFGVYRFNRDYMKKVFLRRNATAYFTFGTLANAAIVSLALLHVAVSGATDWQQRATGFLAAANYGPLVVALSALIFQTDYRLKLASGSPRRFSGLTFIGYGVAFLGLALSLSPLLGLTDLQTPWLQSAFAAQALAIAIVTFAWMVWRYESIPPLFLMLLAVVAQYHVLVGQWVANSHGIESWGVAAIPLFAGMVALDKYFTRWDQRRMTTVAADGQTRGLRFVDPFRIICLSLSIAVVAIAFVSRTESPLWFAATCWSYAGLFLIVSVWRKEAKLVYVSGVLAGCATIGSATELAAFGDQLVSLSIVAFIWSALAAIGQRFGLKADWRTSLVDCGLFSATAVTCLIGGQYVANLGVHSLQFVGVSSALALLVVAAAFFLAAYQYRSWLPVFGGVIALALVSPVWVATLALAAVFAAHHVQKRYRSPKTEIDTAPVKFLGVATLPCGDSLPGLFATPLRSSAIPLALIGWAIAAIQIADGNFSESVLVGASVSAFVLLVLTRTFRVTWLYGVGLLATLFAVNVVAHPFLQRTFPSVDVWSTHLFVSSLLCFVMWAIASGYAAWCRMLLPRIAEAAERPLRASRHFYSGNLFHFTLATMFCTLIATTASWFGDVGDPLWSFGIYLIGAVLFGVAASQYRSQLMTYVSLSAFSLTLLTAIKAFDLYEWDGSAVQVGVAAAIASVLLTWNPLKWRSFARKLDTVKLDTEKRGLKAATEDWLGGVGLLPASGRQLWIQPLAVYAILCSVFAVFRTLHIDVENGFYFQPSANVPYTSLLAGLALALCTRAIRSWQLFVSALCFFTLAIFGQIIFATGSHPWLNGGLSVNLLVASAIAVFACTSGAALALMMNRFSVGESARRLYAATTVKYGCVVGLAAMAGLTVSAVLRPQSGVVGLAACGLLLLAAAMMAKVYRTRLAVYAGLFAACLALHFGFVRFYDVAFYEDYRNLAVALSAVSFGAVAWLVDRRELRQSARVFSFWQSTETPLFSSDHRLWSQPLSNGSILVTLLSIALVVSRWLLSGIEYSSAWVAVAPLLLVCAAWFVASSSRRAGWFTGKDGLSNQWRERGLFVALAMLTFGFAAHLALHLSLQGSGVVFLGADQVSSRLAISWHMLLGAGMTLLVWAVAASYGVRCRDKLSDQYRIYVGIPHLVASAAANAHFVIAGGLVVVSATGMTTQLTSPLLFGGSLVLALYFALVGYSFRTRLGSYLSLAAMGFAAVHVAPLTITYLTTYLSIGDVSLAHGVVWLSALSLMFALLALKLVGAEPHSGLMRQQSMPWPSALMPLRAASFAEAWCQPLGHVAALIAVICLGLFGPLLASQQDASVLVSAVLLTMTFAVTSTLLRRAWPTYFAALTLAVSTLALIRYFNWPPSNVGISLAMLSTACWLVSALAKRAGVKRPEWIVVYEQPLIRCSIALAGASVAHAVSVWLQGTWADAQQPLVTATCFSAVTLLMNARSLSVLNRDTWAKLMVYLGCLSLAGSVLSAYAMLLETVAGIGLLAALLSVVMAAIGLFAVESSKSSLSIFGHPVLRFSLGLAIVALATTTAFVLSPMVPGGLTSVAVAGFASAVCFTIAVRVERSKAWLHAAVVTGSASTLLLIQTRFGLSLSMFVVVGLVYMNAMLFVSQLIRRRPERWMRVLGLSASGCCEPLQVWPAVFTCGVLVWQAIMIHNVVRFDPVAGASWPWTAVGLFSLATCVQLLFARRDLIYVQLSLIASVVFAFGFSMVPGRFVTPDVAIGTLGLAVGVIAAVVNTPAGYRVAETLRLPLSRNARKRSERVLSFWSAGLLAISVVIAIPVVFHFRPIYPSVSLVLAIATVAVIAGGYRWRNETVTSLSALLLPSVIGSALLFYKQPMLLMQYAGLISAIMAVGLLAACRLIDRSDQAECDRAYWSSVRDRALRVSMGFGGLAILQWTVMVSGIAMLDRGGELSVQLATLLAGSLTSVYWLRLAYQQPSEWAASIGTLGCVATVFYFAHSLLEMQLVSSSASAFLVIASSFALFAANTMVSRSREAAARVFLRPTYYLALALPGLLVIAIERTDRSAAALALLAAGAFYLVMTYQSRTRWTIYAAACSLNAAVYLWVPIAREMTGLFQLYVIPAAVTVLIFAQLHRRELKPAVLTGIRLTASGAILAVATLEVFFASGSSLLQFVSVLMLSLTGIVIGISLRIKPFVYMGLAFMILNVVGQLGVRFQNEDGILRAIILIAVGIAVLSAMIFFNVHRERILRQYRSFIATKEWES